MKIPKRKWEDNIKMDLKEIVYEMGGIGFIGTVARSCKDNEPSVQ
jgi:hypothetical protein